MNGLLSKSILTLPGMKISSLWDELLEETRLDSIPSGLSASEDEKNFYVDAALPGVDPKDIEVIYERGILQINAKSQEEESGKRYYRRATSQFSYSVPTPDSVNTKKEPEVTCKNGMVHAVFAKKVSDAEPKKIKVKAD